MSWPRQLGSRFFLALGNMMAGEFAHGVVFGSHQHLAVVAAVAMVLLVFTASISET